MKSYMSYLGQYWARLKNKWDKSIDFKYLGYRIDDKSIRSLSQLSINLARIGVKSESRAGKPPTVSCLLCVGLIEVTTCHHDPGSELVSHPPSPPPQLVGDRGMNSR